MVKEEKILINGLEINYRVDGKSLKRGATSHILILHGWGSNSLKWVNVQKKLIKKGYKVIVLDMPGFGKSKKSKETWGLDEYRDFVNDFVNSLKLNKFYLIGHSFGGSTAIKYSIKYPRKVEKLFLITPSCVRVKTLRKKIFEEIASFLKIFSFLPFYYDLRRAFYKFVIKASDYIYVKAALKETYLKIISEDISPILKMVSIPVTIIWGDKDRITPLKDGILVNQEIKNSEMIIISNQGHNLHIEKPDILSEKILDNL